MRWPLWDEDCSACHASFETAGDASGSPAFHELAVHNVGPRRGLRRVPLRARSRRESRSVLPARGIRPRAVRPLSLGIRRGRMRMRRFRRSCWSARCAAPAVSLAYPGGTPNFQTDAAPYCAGCHSSRSEAALAGAGERAAKEVAERKHLSVLLSGQKGYASLTEVDRRALADQIRALDEASTVTLAAPAALLPGQSFDVRVDVTGGAGPVVGIALVDRDHRWFARPATAAGWRVIAPPKITGPDGQPPDGVARAPSGGVRPQHLLRERREDRLGRGGQELVQGERRLHAARARSPRRLSPRGRLPVRHREIQRARLHHRLGRREGAARRPHRRLGPGALHAGAEHHREGR